MEFQQQRARNGTSAVSSRTCGQCREAHAACDKNRPCGRCVRLLREHLCQDAPRRKRGRPSDSFEVVQFGVTPGAPVPSSSSSLSSSATSRIPADGPNVERHRQLIDEYLQPQLLGFQCDPSQSLTDSDPYAPPDPRQRRQRRRVGDGDELTDIIVATTTTTATSAAQQQQQLYASHGAVPSVRTGSYQQEQRIISLENKVDTLTQLVQTMSDGMQELRQVNTHLRAKIKRLKAIATAASAINHQKTHGRDVAPAVAGHSSSSSSSSSSPSSSASPMGSAASPLHWAGHGVGSATTASSTSRVWAAPLTDRNDERSFSFELSVLHSGVSPALAMEARHQLPWLQYYDIPPRFAVVDFSYPVMVMEKLGTLENPSFMSYANLAFVQLSGYDWDELIGSPHPKLFSFRKSFLGLPAILYGKPPMTASHLFSFGLLLRRKDGRTIRFDDQSQIFYDRNGNGQYSLSCVLGWREEGMQPDETFNTWMPLVKDETLAQQWQPRDPMPHSMAPSAAFTDTSSSLASSPSVVDHGGGLLGGFGHHGP